MKSKSYSEISQNIFLLKCFFAAFFLSSPKILLVEGNRPIGKPIVISTNPPQVEILNPYHREQILDPTGKYKLEWLVEWDEEAIFFNVTVETQGFVIFGLSNRNIYPKADLFIGGVDRVGRSYHGDYHISPGIPIPRKDIKQDWILHCSHQTKTHTFLSFSRLFQTCDVEDFSLDNDDTVLLLWGYASGDHLAEYPFATLGKVPENLRDANRAPKPVLNNLNNPDWDSQPDLGPDVKIWSIKNSFNIPPKRTTYQCKIIKLSLSSKHHIIGFTQKINNETLPNVHHSMLYRCIAKNAEEIFEKFVNNPGEECYDPMVQLGEIPFQTCIELKAGYAIGGEKRPIFFPDDIGIPIGTTGKDEYYLLQTHYDNPTGRSDIVSETQLDLFYSSTLRANDAGLTNIGYSIPGSPGLLVPSNSTGHRIVGQCSSTCTKKMIPPGGITVKAAILHSHMASRSMTLQHFRDNEELPPILQDNSYIPLYQPQRLLRKEVTILPGDHLSVRCLYDSEASVTGGYGIDQEMCVGFILTNLLADFGTICRSELISPYYNAKYLAGTTNLTWYQPKLQYMATAPPNVDGLVVTEISDKLVNWTTALRGELQRDQLTFPQIDFCFSRQEMEELLFEGVVPTVTLSTYPVEVDPYQAPPQCSMSMKDRKQNINIYW